MPLTVTDLPTAAFLSLKVPVAVATVSMSPPIWPAKVAPLVMSGAASVPSYTLSPTMPPTLEILAGAMVRVPVE